MSTSLVPRPLSLSITDVHKALFNAPPLSLTPSLLHSQVSEEDIENIAFLCDQIIEISDYRAQLYDYLKNRWVCLQCYCVHWPL